MPSAREYLSTFPEEISVTEGLVYLIFVCQQLDVRLNIEYDNGLAENWRTGEMIQEEKGWKISVDQNYLVDPDGDGNKEILFTSMAEFVNAGLSMLRATLEQLARESE